MTAPSCFTGRNGRIISCCFLFCALEPKTKKSPFFLPWACHLKSSHRCSHCNLLRVRCHHCILHTYVCSYGSCSSPHLFERHDHHCCWCCPYARHHRFYIRLNIASTPAFLDSFDGHTRLVAQRYLTVLPRPPDHGYRAAPKTCGPRRITLADPNSHRHPEDCESSPRGKGKEDPCRTPQASHAETPQHIHLLAWKLVGNNSRRLRQDK